MIFCRNFLNAYPVACSGIGFCSPTSVELVTATVSGVYFSVHIMSSLPLFHVTEAKEASLTSQGAADLARAHRSEATAHRLRHPPTTNQLATVPTQPTIPLTTAALDNFRNLGYNDADCIKCFFEARISNKVDQRYGATSRPFAPD